MDKTINLIMKDNKDIEIFCNENLKRTIKSDNRQITAKDIYDIFDFSPGENILIKSENNQNIDSIVLDELKNVFENIYEGIKNIKTLNESIEEDDFIKTLDDTIN